MSEGKKKELSAEKLQRLKEKKRIAKAKLNVKKRAARKVQQATQEQPAAGSAISPAEEEKRARIKAKKVLFIHTQQPKKCYVHNLYVLTLN